MVYNLQDNRPDKVKILYKLWSADDITTIEYGPYDNGYVLMGLKTG